MTSDELCSCGHPLSEHVLRHDFDGCTHERCKCKFPRPAARASNEQALLERLRNPFNACGFRGECVTEIEWLRGVIELIRRNTTDERTRKVAHLALGGTRPEGWPAETSDG